jgi:hypothetical protein
VAELVQQHAQEQERDEHNALLRRSIRPARSAPRQSIGETARK